MGNPPTRCLDPEVLAAYLDHGVSLAERARVEAHLASCPQCLALVAGVARTVAALPADRTGVVSAAASTSLPTRRTLARWALAAAAVSAIVVAPPFLGALRNRDMGLVSLADTVAESRPVLGRLTGGFPHAPLGGPSAGGQGGQADEHRRVLLTAGKIRESFGERLTPSRLHAAGVLQLLSGHADEAVDALGAAAREQPANATYLNDLAVAQLERARLGVRPDDLPRALASATRAARLDPASTEARFNRALALSALSLRDQAAAAWSDYLAHDSTSAWATEARAQRETLQRPTPAQAWASIELQLNQGPINASTAEEAVRTQVSSARRYIDTVVMSRWANDVTNGTDAAKARSDLQTFADAMERITGDAFFTYELAVVDRLSAADAKRYAQAYLQFAAAYRFFEQDALTQAAAAAKLAQVDLRAIGSNYALLGDIVIAAAAYYAPDYATAESLLAAAQSTAESRRAWFAAGRAAWLRGMTAFSSGRLDDSQSHYEHTLAVFERIGDVEQATSAHSLLAALFFAMGDKGAEWQHRQLALAGLTVTTSPRAQYVVLASTAASVRFDDPAAALVIQDAAMTAATHSGRVAAAADLMAQRASTLISLERLNEARSTIETARRNLNSISDASLRRLLELPVLMAESDLLRAGDPGASAVAAQRGLDILEQRHAAGDQRRVVQFALRLAKANIALGHLDKASGALTAGLRAFEDDRARTADDLSLASTDEGWQLFDEAAHVAIRRGDFGSAFALAERGRARASAERRSANDGPGLSETQQRLADGEALVMVNQFDDELAVWSITRQHVRVERRSLSRADARALVLRSRLEIAEGSAVASAGAELYEQLIRPLEPELSRVSRLTVVPDPSFEDLSFAALRDRRSRQYLGEQWLVSLLPAASAVRAGVRRAPIEPRTALVVPGATPELGDALSAAYSATLVMPRADLTWPRILEAAEDRQVVHIVAGSQPNERFPRLGSTWLAEAEGRARPTRVFARDIASRRLLHTDLVVLEEDRRAPYRGEGTLDVARAFLTAGVPVTVGTLPGADERAVRDLLIGFHREIAAGLSPEQALQRVQRNAIRQNGGRLGAWCALVLYGSDR